MLNIVIYGMVYAGSALMVYNIYGFVQFARYIQTQTSWRAGNALLYTPIVLLSLFLAGYLGVGIFGNPDLLVAGILFGGSIFVCIMYKLLSKITVGIVEGEQLQAKLLVAEESNRAKSSFLASVSHEMRTPLNIILGLDSVALTNPDIPDVTRTQLTKIGLSARHMLGLINNILDMNYMEVGEHEPKHEEFSLWEDVLAQLDAMVGTLCDEKGLAFAMDVDDRAAGTYIGDELLLSQVLISILDNALKYTDAPGSVTLRVAVESDVDWEHGAAEGEAPLRTLSFAVADTGVGIDAAFMPKLFEAFEREDVSPTSRYGGSGLSLAVAKRSIECMGGGITAQSVKGEGSTFVVTLPLEVCAQASADQDAPASAQGIDTLEGRRVLIAEDIPDNAEIVADLLELEDVQTEHAENGQIAVAMFAQSPAYYYDAILMDLRMPVMDGLDATREIRRLNRVDAREVPIIALTANAFESDKQQSLAAGMNAHLAKPADADMLYSTLKHYMRAVPTE